MADVDCARFDWPKGAPHAPCGGYGCDECEATGRCPGCGREWETNASPSPLPAADCAELGVLPYMCRCGKHWRRPEWVN